MNYDLLFRKLLQIAIERDCINDYLVGRLGFRVKEDPNSDHTHHAFDYGVLVYNQVNKEKPELNLSQKYVESLEKDPSFLFGSVSPLTWRQRLHNRCLDVVDWIYEKITGHDPHEE